MLEHKNENTYGIVKTPANQKLIDHLKSEGAEVIEFPDLETFGKLSSGNAVEILKLVENSDWLIFTDILAVEHFVGFLEKIEFDLFELDDLRVCSFGEAVSDRLRFVQLHTDVVAEKLNTQMVLEDILKYIADKAVFIKTKFLIVKGVSTGDQLKKLIESKNGKAENLSVYEFQDIREMNFTKLKSLLIGGAIDEFIIASPIDLLIIREIFQFDNFQTLFDEITFSAKDDITFQFLRENDVTPKFFSENKRG